MVKNLTISSEKSIKVSKKKIHDLVNKIKNQMEFSISWLEINFVGTEFILDLNKNYLKHHFPTDIITFNYSEESNKLDGEIYISVPEAVENSKNYSVSVDSEIMRLVIHGILHLLGYDDLNLKDKKIMKKVENNLVLQFENTANNLIWKI